MFRFLEIFTEILGWMRIVFGPLLIGSAIGVGLYSVIQNIAGIILGGLFSFCGLIVGIIWANRVWRHDGTINYLSRVNATPELDHPSNSATSNNSDEK